MICTRRRRPAVWPPAALDLPPPAARNPDRDPDPCTHQQRQQVGRGSFAIVLEATNHQTGDRLCAKKLPKFKHNSLPEQQTAAVAAEADTQRVLSAASSAILRFREVRQDSSYYYLISEVRIAASCWGRRWCKCAGRGR